MKNKLTKTIGTALTIIFLTAFAQISIFAQDKENISATAETPAERHENNRKLEGSWSIQVTRRDCASGAVLANFPTMSTFAEGGTMQEYGVSFGATGRGSGHGVWNSIGGRRYSNAFQFFLFGADGVSTGRNVIRRQIELNQSGTEYTSTNVIKTYNNSGVLIGTVCATETGIRFE